MPTLKFTDTAVRAAKPARYTFDGHAGLLLVVGKTSRTFYLKKQERDTGVSRTIKLGRYDQQEFNLRAAADEASRLHAQIDRIGHYTNDQSPEPEGMPTFGEAFERFCASRVKIGKQEQTVRDYRGQVRRNLQWMVDQSLDAIRPRNLQEFFDDNMSDEEGHTASARACRRIISAVYRHAQRDHVVLNPAERGMLDMTPTRKRKPVSNDVYDLWLDIESVEHNPVLRAMWEFALFTGLRSKTVRYLRWDQVDLDAKLVHLEKLKHGGDVTLPLSDHVVTLLRELDRHPTVMHGRTTDVPALVFPSTTGSVDGAWSKIERLVHGRFHDCRKFFSDAAARVGLTDTQWKFLRGDKLQGMQGTYINNGAAHTDANKVADDLLAKINKRPRLQVAV